jgi:hypothetical protein
LAPLTFKIKGFSPKADTIFEFESLLSRTLLIFFSVAGYAISTLYMGLLWVLAGILIEKELPLFNA